MQPVPYAELSDLVLLELCVWREAQNQPPEGMHAVACSIRNRVHHPSWWGRDWHSVILKPWQYSSFNADDPNEKKWPADDDGAFATVTMQCIPVFLGQDADSTFGATHYYDTSIDFPKAWGNEAEWENTLNVGRLRFWRMRPGGA